MVFTLQFKVYPQDMGRQVGALPVQAPDELQRRLRRGVVVNCIIWLDIWTYLEFPQRMNPGLQW